MASPNTLWRPSALKTGLLWMSTGNVCYAACQWGVLIVLTKLGSPEQVGVFASALAVTAPVVLLGNLQLRQILVTDRSRDFSFQDYAGLRLVTSLGSVLFLLGFYGISRSGLNTEGLVVVTIALAKGVESYNDIYQGFLHKHERMKTLATAQAIKGLASLALVSAVFYVFRNVFLAGAALLLAWVIASLAYDIPHCLALWRSLRSESVDGRGMSLFRPRISGRLLRLVKLAAPLGVAIMFASLATNIPRYSIRHYMGLGSLGIFAAVANLQVSAATIVNSLAQVITPRLATHYDQKQYRSFFRALAQAVLGLLGLGLTAVLVSLAAGRQILTLIYNAEYAAYFPLLTLTMVAATVWFVAAILGCALTAMRVLNVQLVLAGSACLVIHVACSLLVPLYGLSGACGAIICGGVVQSCGSAAIMLYSQRSLRAPMSRIGRWTIPFVSPAE